MRLPRLVITVVAILVALCNASRAETDAPFGLKWGASIAQVEALGVKLSGKITGDYGVQFNAQSLPKVLSDAAQVFVAFGHNDKLWRIVVIGRPVANDPYGADLKARYNDLSAALTEKYGNGTQHHFQDTELWKQADEFMMGIKSGRSWYYTNFNTQDITIQLSIRAQSSSAGFYLLIFEHNFLRKEFDRDKAKKEKEAL
jgi:hypothetical protein